jgi:hypothetical protein
LSAEAGRQHRDRLGWRGYIGDRRFRVDSRLRYLYPAEHLTIRLAPVAGRIRYRVIGNDEQAWTQRSLVGHSVVELA